MSRLPLALLALGTILKMAPAAEPEELFSAPPPEAHVGVWWHWMGGQVTEEGIVRDLDWLKRMGVFSATVFGMADSCTPWAKRIANVPTAGLRPYDERWWRLFAFACREGRKRGIDIGIHNCPGYTSTGGPWIPSRLAMRELVFNVTNAAEQISLVPKALAPVYDEENRCFGLPDCPARRTDLVEIGVGRGGVHIAHIPMGAYVQPADWDSFGLECDKMNPEAVDFHLDHVFGELKRHLGDDLPAAGLRHILLDSYEAGTPNWTPRMREEFKSRRGYDPLEYLPILGGFTNLYTAAEITRFRADFDRTVKDLYRDVLFARMSARIHREGLEFSNEPYSGPFDAAEVAPYVDRLMTEFWHWPKQTPNPRASRLAYDTYLSPTGGRHNVIEAEAFTGQPEACAWTEMPATLKPSADGAYLTGVNRFILHSFTHQPWGDDVKPGVTMGRWGTHFGRNQTWAESGRSLFDYFARCQALLQWGRPSRAKLGLPHVLGQIARTDGRRTLHFLVATAAVEMPREFRRGRWFDPVEGTVGRVPTHLVKGESGFWEKSDLEETADPCYEARELADIEPAPGDWTKSDDPSVRYFSGTRTYRASFDLPTVPEGAALAVEAGDQVVVVRLNGRPVGTVWCAPNRLDLPVECLLRGSNRLELDVTNAWCNRLIGDEQEPADCAFAPAPYPGGEMLLAYPDWFARGLSARPSPRRRCFTTWNYFTRESSLMPSGLVRAPVLMIQKK